MKEKYKGRMYGIAGAVILGVMLLGVGIYTRIILQQQEVIVAWINDIPVSQEEVLLYTDDIENTEAVQKAVGELVWYKLLQQEMIEKGVLEDTSYTYFKKQLEEENEKRRRQKENGEVLYGPEQYSEKLYYEYCMEEYESIWREQIQEEPAEKELRWMYEDNPDWFVEFGEVCMQYVSLTEEQLEAMGIQSSDLRLWKEQLARKVDSGMSFDETVKELGYIWDIGERVYTEQSLSEPEVAAYPDISELVHTLEEGKVSEVVALDRQYLVFYCKDRKEGRRSTFEDCRDVLREMYQESFLEEMKTKACEEAVIVYSSMLSDK